VRSLLTFSLLVTVKIGSRLFYRYDIEWIGRPAPEVWSRLRLVAILNHTSLYEWLWIGFVPLRFLWRIARHGVVPAAEKTLRRPLIGLFFKLIARHVVSVTRQRDHTWRAVLDRIGEESMVLLAPEGRMKRADGLDSHGQPMTVRGGIADILDAIGHGPLMLAYSGGLHHVQVPGQLVPRLFQTLRMRLEVLEIAAYRAAMAGDDPEDLKANVKQDLERRRDLYCAAPK
jgi:1-acyl-sn-glycerol-3-phosphate acyltransferase